jgi:hypothetical protein
MDSEGLGRECVHSRKTLARLARQMMGDLPRVRIVPGHVFQSDGLDFMGPFKVKVGRAIAKR